MTTQNKADKPLRLPKRRQKTEITIILGGASSTMTVAKLLTKREATRAFRDLVDNTAIYRRAAAVYAFPCARKSPLDSRGGQG